MHNIIIFILQEMHDPSLSIEYSTSSSSSSTSDISEAVISEDGKLGMLIQIDSDIPYCNT